MKHPELERKLNEMEYEKLYQSHAGRYLAWSVSGLVGVCAIVYLLVRPQWPTAVMSVLFCSGFVLCVCASAMLGKRRARELLRVPKPDTVKRNVSGG